MITAIPDATHITVGTLTNVHDGTEAPFPIVQPAVAFEETVYTTCAAKVGPNPGSPNDPVVIPVIASSGFVVGQQVVIDSVDARRIQEAQVITDVPDATHITVAMLANEHDGGRVPFPIVQPGEKGTLIAEWDEYTPTSGTDIAVKSDLSAIA